MHLISSTNTILDQKSFFWLDEDNHLRLYPKLCRSILKQVRTWPGSLQQCHSDIVREINLNQNACDGIITTNQSIPLICYTADCIPIFGQNAHSRFILHAGWRGLCDGIIDQLIAHPNCQGTYDITIGPHISQSHFQVKDDFIQAWQHEPLFESFYANEHFDLFGYASTKLKPITRTLSHFSKCTLSNHDVASYRRDGMKAINLMVHWP